METLCLEMGIYCGDSAHMELAQENKAEYSDNILKKGARLLGLPIHISEL
jgi:hypothetical protein